MLVIDIHCYLNPLLRRICGIVLLRRSCVVMLYFFFPMSKSDINGNRPGSDSCLLPLLNDASMKNDWRHEIFGVHY